MKEKFQRFMIGRYGVDAFAKFIMGVTMVMLLLSIFFPWDGLNIVILLLLGYCYFRMFSRNIAMRAAENRSFLNMKNTLFSSWSRRKQQKEQKKIYHIYRCPKCKQKIRIPKGKGNICVTCPKCKTEFQKKS